MKELIHQIATRLQRRRSKYALPVDAPNFPNDLEPVIRVSSPHVDCFEEGEVMPLEASSWMRPCLSPIPRRMVGNVRCWRA